MKNFRISSVAAYLFFVLVFVASCRNDEVQITTEQRPNANESSLDTNRNARLMGNGISRDAWENNLTWAQQNWINQQSDPDDISYSLWNDEQILGNYLSTEGFSNDIVIGYPLYTYQIAAIGALHTKSIGASAAYTWVQMTYTTGYASVVYDIMYNFEVGKGVAQSYPNASDLLDKVYKAMFIDASNYKVPGMSPAGNYRGVPLYTAAYLIFGSFTLPGQTRALGGIYLQAGHQNDQDLIKHEFGHILQAEDSGISCFYNLTSKLSAGSAAAGFVNSNYSHKCFATETDANTRSYGLLLFENSNAVWNQSKFPLQCPGYGAYAFCQ